MVRAVAIGVGLVLSLSVNAADVEGVVTKVADGDTITVAGRDVRLQGIDAPERDEPHGNEATAALKSVILHRRVRLEVQGTDQYGRLIAVVYRDGRNINRWLVQQGHVWEYDRYSDDPLLGCRAMAGGPTCGVSIPPGGTIQLGKAPEATTAE